MDLPLRKVLEKPVLADLAAEIEAAVSAGGAGAAPPPIRPVPRDGSLPLSFAQERLWFLDRLQEGGAVYNVPLAVRLRGDLEIPALAAAFGEIVRRHETLRTTFPERDGEPVQVIAPAAGLPPWELPVVDLAALPGSVRAAEVRVLEERESLWPFPLERGPLLRSTAFRLAERDHLLLLNMHHVISDGWSLGVLLSEASVLYGAVLAGEPSPLPPLGVQYADFAAWQRRGSRARGSQNRSTSGSASSRGPPPCSSCPPTGRGPRCRPSTAAGRRCGSRPASPTGWGRSPAAGESLRSCSSSRPGRRSSCARRARRIWWSGSPSPAASGRRSSR